MHRCKLGERQRGLATKRDARAADDGRQELWKRAFGGQASRTSITAQGWGCLLWAMIGPRKTN